MIRTEINDTEVQRAFAQVAAGLSNPTELMQDAGEYLVNSTKERFQEGRAPDGTPWAPKSQTTLDQYLRSGDGALTRPLIGPSKTLSTTINYAASDDSVEWGSNVIQAAVMQMGAQKGAFGSMANGSSIPWGNIPARPYLGVDEEDRDALFTITREWLEDLA